MKNKIVLILLVITAVLLFAYSGKFTGSSFNDAASSTGNVLRVKNAPLFGAADNFVVLAGSGITNTGTTVITGDIGSAPTYSAPGGTIKLTGTDHGADAFTQAAKTNLDIAYGDAVGRTPVTIATELGGTSPAPGVYNSAAGTFAITGILTLNGNATDVWIFQTATTLITADNSKIVLIGAKATNVYWVVGSSATLGTNTIFEGNIMALTSITLNTGANVEGRLLAQAAVTLDGNTIVKPAP